MVNYQLYRTNVLLGGQMKYDLILDNSHGLSITDFHITPISNKVPYNKHIKEDLLNYVHADNISKYYKSISGSFYKDFVSSELTNLYPIIPTENTSEYDDTYETGCRRINYKLYNKQFSYLCPIWLEQLKESECLMFEFNLYADVQQTKKIASSELYVDVFKSNNGDELYHNKFVKYFNEYLNYIGCNEGNDWVMNVKEDCTLINGVNVETGFNKMAKSKFIFQNLTSRERPLLEQNNMLINEMPNNKLITKQLINFNFCFNLLDLCGSTSSYQLINNYLFGKNLYVDVNVNVCDKQTKNIIYKLERRDLFSNHDYIKKFYCGPNRIKLDYINNKIEIIQNPQIYESNEEFNVLSYLQDYNCIDLIDKNKIVQNTIHWATTDSPEITFNFYRGFAGYLLDSNNKAIMLKDSNAYTPNIDIETYEYYLNQYWCNSIELKEDLNINDSDYEFNKNLYIEFAKSIINDPSSYSFLFSKFNDDCIVKNIKYKIDNPRTPMDDIYTLILVNNINKYTIDDDIIEDNSLFYKKQIDTNMGVFLIADKRDNNNIKRYIILVYNNEEDKIYLPLKQIKKIFEKIQDSLLTNDHPVAENTKSIIKDFIEIVNSQKTSNHVYVTIPNSLDAVMVPGPSLSVKEFEFFKNRNSKFIERNIGKINPMFITEDSDNFFNFKFSKLTIDEAKNIPKYFDYQKLGYLAKYPSINYYPFKKKIQTYNYNYSSNPSKFEYNNLHYNKLLNISADLSTTLISKRDDNGQYKQIKDIVYDYIKQIYNIQSDDFLEYIISLYEYKYDFEYETNTWDPAVGPNYIYNIEIKLK